jgi:PAS domain S-box-containing protein
MQKIFAKFHPRLILVVLCVLLGGISLGFSFGYIKQAMDLRKKTKLTIHYQESFEHAQVLELALLKEAYLGLVLKYIGDAGIPAQKIAEGFGEAQSEAEMRLQALLASVDRFDDVAKELNNQDFDKTMTRFHRGWREQRRQWVSISSEQGYDWFRRHTVLISKLNLAMTQLRSELQLQGGHLEDQRLIQETSKRFFIDVVDESVLKLLNTDDASELLAVRKLQLRDQLLLEDYMFHVLREQDTQAAQALFSQSMEKLKFWRLRWQNTSRWRLDPALLERWTVELVATLDSIQEFRQSLDRSWNDLNQETLAKAGRQFWISQFFALLTILCCIAISAVSRGGFFKPLRQLRSDLDAVSNGRFNYDLSNPLPTPTFRAIYHTMNKVREQLSYREHILEERTAFFEYCPEIIATLDWEGRFHDTNEAFNRILGFSKESLLGLLYLELVHPLDRDLFIDSAKDLITEKKVLRMELRCLKRDGQFIWLQLHAVALQKNRLIYCVASDISQIKHTETELMAAKEAAERANTAKTEFLANMSHEIRTPINGILGAAQIIDETALDAHQQEFMGILKQSADGLLNVVNDILDISKIEAGRLDLDTHPFDLEALCQIAVEHTAMDVSKQDKRIEVLLEYAADCPRWVIGDDKRFRQVLLNLLGNAVKFTSEGHVLLQVLGRVNQGSVDLDIRVEDTGCGIPENRQKSIFEKFTQADASTTRRYGGTGLGLAICNGILNKMKGTLGVQSTPGQGTNFIIEVSLPLDMDKPLPTKAKLDRGLAMVISSHAPSNRVSVDLLRRLGYVTLGLHDVSDWQEALHQSMVPSERVNLVVIDLDWGVFDNSSSISGLIEHPCFASAQWVYLGYGPLEILNAMSDAQHYLKKPLTLPKLEQLDFISKQVQDSRIEKAPESLPIPEHKFRILVVEDNKVNSKIVTRLLSRLGYETELAENGVEALDILAGNQDFQLVLMDCQMPIMDGYEATRQIRKLPGEIQNITVIAMTAHAMEGDRERCLAAGMDDYMTKPIDFKLLRQKLKEYLVSADPSPVKSPLN